MHWVRNFASTVVRGNHEDLWLQWAASRDPRVMQDLRHNGGAATLAAYRTLQDWLQDMPHGTPGRLWRWHNRAGMDTGAGAGGVVTLWDPDSGMAWAVSWRVVSRRPAARSLELTSDMAQGVSDLSWPERSIIAVAHSQTCWVTSSLRHLHPTKAHDVPIALKTAPCTRPLATVRFVDRHCLERLTQSHSPNGNFSQYLHTKKET